MKFKPFYQGKLDVFCAIYAVLNALRLTHGIRTLKAREILNETLLGIATKPAAFRAVLNQETDYVALVDNMLQIQAKRLPLKIERPFLAADLPNLDKLWTTCYNWLNPNGAKAEQRAIIMRFSRHDKIGEPAALRHWTVVSEMDLETMHLYDSSHEAEAIQNLKKSAVAATIREVDEAHRIQIHADSIRFLRLPF